MELFRPRLNFTILHLSQGLQMFSENQDAEWKRQFVDNQLSIRSHADISTF